MRENEPENERWKWKEKTSIYMSVHINETLWKFMTKRSRASWAVRWNLWERGRKEEKMIQKTRSESARERTQRGEKKEREKTKLKPCLFTMIILKERRKKERKKTQHIMKPSRKTYRKPTAYIYENENHIYIWKKTCLSKKWKRRKSRGKQRKRIYIEHGPLLSIKPRTETILLLSVPSLFHIGCFHLSTPACPLLAPCHCFCYMLASFAITCHWLCWSNYTVWLLSITLSSYLLVYVIVFTLTAGLPVRHETLLSVRWNETWERDNERNEAIRCCHPMSVVRCRLLSVH